MHVKYTRLLHASSLASICELLSPNNKGSCCKTVRGSFHSRVFEMLTNSDVRLFEKRDTALMVGLDPTFKFFPICPLSPPAVGRPPPVPRPPPLLFHYLLTRRPQNHNIFWLPLAEAGFFDKIVVFVAQITTSCQTLSYFKSWKKKNNFLVFILVCDSPRCPIPFTFCVDFTLMKKNSLKSITYLINCK